MNRTSERGPRPTQTLEFAGRSLDEAIRLAAERLRVPKEDLLVEVLEEGRGGFLGLGAREARIRARVRPIAQRNGGRVHRGPSDRGPSDRGPSDRARGREDVRPRRSAPAERVRPEPRPEPRPDRGRDLAVRPLREASTRGGPDRGNPPANAEQEKAIVDYASGLLSRMGFPGRVEIRVEDEAYLLLVEAGDDDALLIGRGGETLDAIQHIVSKAATQGQDERTQIRVDIAGYRQRREDQLSQRALQMADQVRRSGRGMTTLPLNASERRIVHRTLSETAGIQTRALGDGLLKKVLIEPSGGSEIRSDGERPRAPRPERPERPERLERQATSEAVGSPDDEPAPAREEIPTRPVTPSPEHEIERPEKKRIGAGAETAERGEVDNWGRKPRPGNRRLGRR